MKGGREVREVREGGREGGRKRRRKRIRLLKTWFKLTQPFHHFLDFSYKPLIFHLRICVIVSQVAHPSVYLHVHDNSHTQPLNAHPPSHHTHDTDPCKTEIEIDGHGVANVEDTIWLWWKSCHHLWISYCLLSVCRSSHIYGSS